MFILNIICHDLGRELGCYGRPVESPHLDALAADGVMFTNAHCVAACCSPARVSLWTGRHAQQSGVLGLAHCGWPLPAEARTIVDDFNAAGWLTVHCGHQHERRAASENRYQVETNRGEEGAKRAGSAVDQALAFLNSYVPDGAPVYMNVGLHDPHPSTWLHSYQGAAHNPPLAYCPDFIPFLPAALPELPAGVDASCQQESLRAFHGAISFTDHHIGRLLATLREKDLYDDALILFTTDHGLCLGPRTKGTLYDLGTAVALLVKLPGGQHAGSRIDGLAHHLDVVPTLLAAGGVPIPDRLTGTSRWADLLAGQYTAPEAIFCERTYHGGPSAAGYYQPSRAVRTDDHLLLRHYAGLGAPHDVIATELFDLRADPQCCGSGLPEAEQAEVRAGLNERLDSWMTVVGDPLLVGHAPGPIVPS